MTPEKGEPLAPILCDPDRLSSKHYDVIVIGGGIQGAALLYEAAKRGLRGLLIEKHDFGGQTSWNSMRILHGGFRYLQSMDLVRLRDSVRERRWYMRMFPGLTSDLRCLMPLYGQGLKKPETFGAALKLYEQLSRLERRRRGESRLPAGKVISRSDVTQSWPRVPTIGLRGGGVWHDAQMQSTERVVMHLIRAAVTMGSQAVNYMTAERIETVEGAVVGAACRDSVTGREVVFHSPLILNAAGAGARAILGKVASDRPELFPPLRCFNLVLNKRSPSACALAVSRPEPGSQTYFLVPFGEQLIVGTANIPVREGKPRAVPSQDEVEDLLGEINGAAPGLDVDLSDVACVWSGLVPARYGGSTQPAERPVVIDHTEYGGPAGLISISGVKYTTARLVAQRVVAQLPGPPVTPLADVPCEEVIEEVPGYGEKASITDFGPRLRDIVQNEAVRFADDLVIRRTGLWRYPDHVRRHWRDIAFVLGLEGEAADREERRLSESLRLLKEPWNTSEAGD